MLVGLGWEFGRLSTEIVEEARIRGRALLRMDYAGVNPTSLIARLIVEAKAWSKSFVYPSDQALRAGRVPATTEALLVKAIEHYKHTLDLTGSPVIREWAESISTLSGRSPRRPGHFAGTHDQRRGTTLHRLRPRSRETAHKTPDVMSGCDAVDGSSTGV